MKRYVELLPFFIGVLVMGACSQMKGYKIEGSAPLAEFEGKMVYMKDASTNSLIDSASKWKVCFCRHDQCRKTGN